MSGGLIIPDKQTAKALNDLARHKTILRLLQDIRIDMEICEIEGWDKTEYLIQIKQLINSMGGTAEMTELKPCPFCGSEAEVRIIYDELETKDVPRFSYVRCVRCFSQTAEYSFKDSDRTGINPREASIKAWNRRVECKN